MNPKVCFPILSSCFALGLTQSPLSAAEPKSFWETQRVTSPDSLEELKTFEHRIQQKAKELRPTVVGIAHGGSNGSGVIIDGDGLVMTAMHVVDHVPVGGKVKVLTCDAKWVTAEVLGGDFKRDISLIRITDKPPEGSTWPSAKDGKWAFAKQGEPSKLKKGQWLFLYGHHGGCSEDRPAPVRLARYHSTFDHVLQIYSFVEPGDSGGPLFDFDGCLEGVASRIEFLGTTKVDRTPYVKYSRISDAEPDRNRWLAGERLHSPPNKLGICVCAKKNGLCVSEVKVNSPAEKSGIKTGDIINKIEGEEIEDMVDFEDALHKLKATKPATIHLLREGKEVTVTITVSSAIDDDDDF